MIVFMQPTITGLQEIKGVEYVKRLIASGEVKQINEITYLKIEDESITKH